jgi:voltage-gated potassium channel
MATVGYGDYLPHTGIQKMFATTLAIGGVGLLAYVFNLILTNFQERMSKFSKGARKMGTIKNMDDYFILCGHGRVGKVVLEELTQRNQNVIVIDKSEEVCESIEESNSVVVLQKDATQDEMITELAGEKCNSVIISTGDDVTNLFIVLTIRETNQDTWIVTRASKVENISRLRKAGADKIVSPEVIGGKDLYYEATNPHILKLTVKHSVDDILDEFKIISKHGCTLETIEYHLPGIKTPLKRKIKTMELEDGKRFTNYLKTHPTEKAALNNIYNSTNNIHSHLISGPDRATFERLIKDLETQEEILGKNLNDKEIAKMTGKILKKE